MSENALLLGCKQLLSATHATMLGALLVALQAGRRAARLRHVPLMLVVPHRPRASWTSRWRVLAQLAAQAVAVWRIRSIFILPRLVQAHLLQWQALASVCQCWATRSPPRLRQRMAPCRLCCPSFYSLHRLLEEQATTVQLLLLPLQEVLSALVLVVLHHLLLALVRNGGDLLALQRMFNRRKRLMLRLLPLWAHLSRAGEIATACPPPVRLLPVLLKTKRCGGSCAAQAQSVS